MRWIGVFKELAYDGAFVEGFAFVGQGGDETARIEFEKGQGFLVWVYFDVLEGDAFFEEEEEDALGEGAELVSGVSECKIAEMRKGMGMGERIPIQHRA